MQHTYITPTDRTYVKPGIKDLWRLLFLENLVKKSCIHRAHFVSSTYLLLLVLSDLDDLLLHNKWQDELVKQEAMQDHE